MNSYFNPFNRSDKDHLRREGSRFARRLAILTLTVALGSVVVGFKGEEPKSDSKAPSASTQSSPIQSPTFRSVKELDAFIAQVKAERRKWGKDDSKGTAGYLEALRERLFIRAYPNDRPDEDAYFEALQHMSQMPSATAFQRSLAGGVDSSTGLQINPITGIPVRSGNVGTTPGTWDFFGPQGLGIPYRIYYGPPDAALNGRIAGLAYDPTNPQTLYLGAPAGGVWKSTDSGVTWRPLGNGFTAPYISRVAVSPSNSNLVIAGMGDPDGGQGSGNGVLRSTDGGTTWSNVVLNGGSSMRVSEIMFDPDDSSVVTVVADSGGGLYRSVDGGASFTRLTVGGSNNRNFTEMSIGIPNGSGVRRYYVSDRQGGLFYSEDRGQTWTALNAPSGWAGRTFIGASRVDPNKLFTISNSSQRVHVGTISGGTATWTDITSNLPAGYNWSQSWYDMHLNVAKHKRNGVDTDFVYVGLITLACWNGSTWTDVGRTYTNSALTHNDAHVMTVNPANETEMLIGNDGGVWPLKFNETNQTWTFNNRSSNTLGITMFYSAAFHPWSTVRLMGGTQDNASPVALGDLKNWVNRTGGDGMGCAWSPSNPNIAFGSAQNNGLYRTTNGWVSQSGFGPDWGSDPRPFVTKMAIEPQATAALYVGTNHLWRFNTTEGGTWDARLGNTNLCPSGGAIYSIAVAPSDRRVLYVGTEQGQLWTSVDRGATWRQLDTILSPAFTRRTITHIRVHPTNKNQIWFTVGGTGTPHLYRVADTTATTPVLENVSGSGGTALPNIFTSWMAIDDQQPNSRWWVATDIGVFATTNGGATWTNATNSLGMPVCEVSRLEWVPGTQLLMAATYGRGMWRLAVKGGGVTTGTPNIRWNHAPRLVGSAVAIRSAAQNSGTALLDDLRISDVSLRIGNNTYRPNTLWPIVAGSILTGQATSRIFNITVPAGAARTGTYRIEGSYVHAGKRVDIVESATISW